MSDQQPFQERGGPNLPLGIEYPLGYFLCLFTDEFIDVLVFNTNFYAHQKQKKFEPATSQSMKIFLAINLLMGVKDCPSYKDCWSANPQLRDQYISSLMPVNRFSWFLAHLHLADNNLQPKKNDFFYDKLYKVRPLIDSLSKTFLLHYNPNKNQSIDESMIRFKGRNSIQQYMPMKPIKRGYKVWIRTDQSGYICEFQIYTGKTESAESSLGKRVVQDLTHNIRNKYHCVYFDNFFTSLELLEELLQDGIYGCGTVRSNRKGLPKNQQCDKQF